MKPLKGLPFITNYTKEDHGGNSQVFQMRQDKRGMLYLANGCGGILEYDGFYWNSITLPNDNLCVTALATSGQGRIYVGSIGEMGWFEPNYEQNETFGKWQYHSIAPCIEDKLAYQAQRTRNIELFENNVYFAGGTKVYVVENVNNNNQDSTPSNCHTEVIVWDFQRSASLIKGSDGQLYVSTPEGIGKIKKDTFAILKNSKAVTSLTTDLVSIQQLQDSLYYIISIENKHFLLNTNSNNLQKRTTSDTKLEKEKIIFKAHSLSPSSYALATFTGGIQIVDNKLNRLNTYTKNDGLVDDVVFHLSPLFDGSLAASTNSGISILETSLPLTVYDRHKGLTEDKILTIHRHTDGVLYVGTSTKLYALDSITDQFNPIKETLAQVWDLESYSTDHSEHLIFATADGLFEVVNKKTDRLIKKLSTYSIAKHPSSPRFIFVSGRGIFYILNRKLGGWSIKSFIINNRPLNFYSGFFDKNENFWLQTMNQGFFKIDANFLKDHMAKENAIPVVSIAKMDTVPTTFVSHYDTTRGLPSNDANFEFLLDGDIYVNTANNIYRFDELSDSFCLDTISGINTLLLKDSIKILHRPIENKGTIWYYTRSKNRGAFVKGIDGKYQLGHSVLKRIKQHSTTHNDIYAENNGVVWFGSGKGLYRYDSNIAWSPPPINVFIRQLLINDDSVAFWGNSSENGYIGHQKFSYSDISRYDFRYAATDYAGNRRTNYQYYLEGYDKTWSKWTKETEKSYTRLWEGDYTFKVKARSAYGSEAEASYPFRVFPPWYRTTWAYSLYLVLTSGIIIGIVKWNSHRLRTANLKLENIVKQRTSELKGKNETLQEKQAELQNQQEEILATNEELVHNLHLLEQAYTHREDLIAILSQKISGPLIRINGLTQLIGLAGKLNDKQTKYLHAVEQALGNGVGILQELIHIESGELRNRELKIETLTINGLVSSQIDEWKKLAGRYHVQFHYQLHHIFSFESDRFFLYQLLDRVVHFTVAHTKDKIKMEFSITSETLRISIRYAGKQMSLEDRQQVFLKYTYSDKSIDTVNLFYAKLLVDKLNGKIQLEPNSYGMQLQITLPLKYLIDELLLSDEEVELLYEELLLLFEQEKLYKDPNLSLDMLANRMDLYYKKLTYLIQKKTGANFKTLVNQYRVKEACKLLRNDKYSHLSYLAIGFEAGFNSKSAFYKVFKSLTGNSPKFYREKADK